MAAVLSDRKKKVLQAIIKQYVESGEPVGSKLIADMPGIHASSATIRNEMAELTEMGYLIQPHTSAGRIPSEQAYRYYVDSLMESYNSTSEEIASLNELLKTRTEQLDRIIDDAGKLASALTNYPAISVRSNKRRQVVKRFSVMQNDATSFLLIMLIAKDTVRTKNISTKVYMDETALANLQDVLNRNLANQDLDTLPYFRMMEMEKQLGEYGFLASPIVKSIYDALSEDAESDVKIEGVDRLLSYPEFSDVGKLKSLLGLFEQKEELASIVEESDKSGLNVLIGSENTVSTMNDSTLIFRTIRVDGVDVGAIGIIGPCRMDYEKVISTINLLTQSISEMMKSASALPTGQEQKTLPAGQGPVPKAPTGKEGVSPPDNKTE